MGVVQNSTDEEFEEANQIMNADQGGEDLSGTNAEQVEITGITAYHNNKIELTVSVPGGTSLGQRFEPADLREYRDAWDVETIQEFDGQMVLMNRTDEGDPYIVGPVTGAAQHD